MTRFTGCLAAFLATVVLAGQDGARAQVSAPAGAAASQLSDSATVAETVEAFHRALQTGDTLGASELLADDVTIAEAGGVEGREEYLSHHLPADMAYAAAVTRERGPISVTILGAAAWAVSTTRTTGSFRGRPIDSTGAELMVLSREGTRWRIRAIHWSSRQGG